MKKEKKVNLSLEDLKVESFVTSMETKNVVTGLPIKTNPVPKDSQGEENCTYYWCGGITENKQKCTNVTEIGNAISDVYAPLCNPWQAFKSLVFGGGLPFYC